MKIKYLIKSLIYPGIVAAVFGFLSISFSTLLFSNPDDGLVINFLANQVITDEIESQGTPFVDAAGPVCNVFGYSVVTGLAITLIFGFGWVLISHFLNVDGPGKSKIYSIYWITNSAAFAGLLIILSLFVFFSPGGTTFLGSQYITGGGATKLTIGLLVFYILMYYLIVLLGTARHNRSSVLLAFKLPGDL